MTHANTTTSRRVPTMRQPQQHHAVRGGHAPTDRPAGVVVSAGDLGASRSGDVSEGHGDQEAQVWTTVLNLGFSGGAGDENRTRTVSLGIAKIRILAGPAAGHGGPKRPGLPRPVPRLWPVNGPEWRAGYSGWRTSSTWKYPTGFGPSVTMTTAPAWMRCRPSFSTASQRPSAGERQAPAVKSWRMNDARPVVAECGGTKALAAYGAAGGPDRRPPWSLVSQTITPRNGQNAGTITAASIADHWLALSRSTSDLGG